jgi:hypothetical protein
MRESLMAQQRRRITWTDSFDEAVSTDGRFKVKRAVTGDPMFVEWVLYEAREIVGGKEWRRVAAFDSQLEAKRQAEYIAAR